MKISRLTPHEKNVVWHLANKNFEKEKSKTGETTEMIKVCGRYHKVWIELHTGTEFIIIGDRRVYFNGVPNNSDNMIEEHQL